MWLVLALFASVAYVSAWRYVPGCPKGCDCRAATFYTVLLVDCTHILPDVDQEQLSHQLDSILSAEHFVEHLTSLIITNTPLTLVPASVCKLLNLTSLNLDFNRLIQLPDNCFTKLTKLVTLSATYNTITRLQDGLFDGIQSLLNLDLSHNKIAFIGLRMFSNYSVLTNLRSMDLSYNNLTSLEPWWYYRCTLGNETTPVYIALQFNLISNFTNQLQFQYRCGMKPLYGELNLRNNRIRHITDIFQSWNTGGSRLYSALLCLTNHTGTHGRMTIDVSGDRPTYTCDCTVFPCHKLQMLFSYNILNVSNGVRCGASNSPASESGPALSTNNRMPLSRFTCQFQNCCPSRCRCVYRPANMTLHVYCSAANLSSLPLDLPPLHKSGVKYKLDFSNNKLLRHLDPRPYFVNTSILDVSNCSLTHITMNTLKEVSRFWLVNIRGNMIQSFPRQADTVNISARLLIGDNPWRCSCDNSWIIGWLQSLSNQIADPEDIRCASPSNMYGRNISMSDVSDFCSGCNCEIAHNYTRLDVECGYQDVYDEELSNFLDSMLSAEHFVEHLTSLRITNSSLTRVPASICKLLNLTSLNLDHNKLTELPDNCFTKLTKLVAVSATNNAIIGLQDGLFDGLQRLATLRLDRNNITFIGLRVFSNSSDLVSLRLVDLSNNRLTSLEPWWFYRCILGDETYPVYIDLQFNLISNFTNRLQFQYRCGMKPLYGELNLHNNRIRHIMDILKGWDIAGSRLFSSLLCLTDLKGTHGRLRFDLSGDTYTCDCTDYPFYKMKWLFPYSILIFLYGVRCGASNFPPSEHGSASYAIRMPLSRFTCQHEDGCPSSCRCVYRPANATLHVYCSAANLSSVPLDLPPLPKSYVKYKLDFSNNKLLRRLEHRPYFVNTSILDVSNCSLADITMNTLKDVSRFKLVNFQGNMVQSIPRHADTVNILARLLIGNNPWRCSCDNSWMIGWLQSLSHQISDPGDITCGSPSRMYGRNILMSDVLDFCANCCCKVAYKYTRLDVECGYQDLYDKERSNCLDSMLSAKHFVEHLTSLRITNSSLTRVPASVCKLLNLNSLNLDHNKLNELPDNCFTKLTKLVEVSATNNAVIGLQDGLFDGLQRLATLRLDRNNITFIGLRVFSNSSDLISLRLVDLSYNRLTSLEPWWYYRCVLGNETSPVTIKLHDNWISNFTNEEQSDFRCGMKRPYGYLDLHSNRIAHITDIIQGWYLTVFAAFCLSYDPKGHQRMIFNLAGSSYDCDCADFPIYVLQKSYPNSVLLSGVRCGQNFHTPIGQSVYANSIPLNQFACELSNGCPSSCRCVYRPANATLHVYCSAANLSSLPLDLPPLPKSYVKYKLDFSNNKLRRLEHRPYFVDTAILDVSNNRLTEVSVNVLKDMSRFRLVNFRGNMLQSFPRQAYTVNISARLLIGHNPWRCSCDNSWMIGWLQSLSHQISDPGDVVCRSPSRMYGRNVLKSTEKYFCVDPVKRYLTVIISLTVVVATIVLAVISGIISYKLRLQFYKRWKFHPFDRDECVGEDMDYDVFLCCSSDDNTPHGLRILREIESKRYRVCYHLRDFLAGAPITENMIQSIERSKRTVCLLSNNFLMSSFCMTEFDMAYHHNVAVKRKKRLIVLMMLDRPTDLYTNDAADTATLRQYLRQYTYIDYTTDDWLDKLLYALPLRGLLQHNEDRSDDVQLQPNEDSNYEHVPLFENVQLQ